MLYNEHLARADTFLRNRPNHGQTLIKNFYIADTFIAGICYSGHFFEHRVSILSKNFLLLAETLWLVGKKRNTCMLNLTYFFTLTLTFFHFNFPVTSTRMWWFVNWRNLELGIVTDEDENRKITATEALKKLDEVKNFIPLEYDL